ncbi:MAG: DNA primase catalytic subunit PriS [Candidatus Altiarchaeales archaeon]|nr:DNA primase catalytic subunit PriS [Candidatus Altiarchaeales archaeon]
MEVDTKVFLAKRFKDYYIRNTAEPPQRIEQREFGFGTLEEKIKFRHRSFKNGRELQNYLQRETPFYISYSAAYYEFPENKTMKEKSWLGADLVFDLDAEMPLLDEKILEAVRRQTTNLLEFLVDDFDLSMNDISINFSGSKGYHIHCRDEKVLKLSGDARREIVDYVTATGMDRKCFLREEEVQNGIVFSKSEKRSPRIRSSILVGPNKDSTGWPKRIYEGVLDYIENSKMSAEKKNKLLESLEKGFWEGVEGFREKSFDKIIENYAVRLTGDTDKMVTLDTSRLIRLPDSLHGGTGLKAARVKDISSFNPQFDAIAFGESEVKVRTTSDIDSFKLKDKRYGPYKVGEQASLPEYAAVYLMLKDKAELAR